MKFNSSARYNRKAFNSEKLFDMGIHDAGTVENTCGYPWDIPLTGWGFRKEITITDENANCQIRFTVHRSIGVDAGYVVYVDTKCEDDYDDIRFTAADGTTLLPYWIESSDSNTAYIWVKTNGETTMYLYYGNSLASSESSGSSVFDFFDDFPGSTVDTSKWTATESPTVTGGTVVIASGKSLVGKTNFGVDYIVRLKMKSSAFGSTGFPYFGFRTTGNGAFTWEVAGIFCIYTISGGGTRVPLSSNPSINTYYTYEIARRSTTSVLFSASGFSSVQSTTNIPTDNLPITLSTAGTSAPTVTFDWVLVRKYTATEPTVSAWGSEETGAILPAPITEFQFTHTPGNITNSVTHAYEFAPANITATVENSPEEWCSVFIDTTPVFSVPFDGGSSEIIVGETVTGATSGATGTVTLVVVTGGTWGGGDAEGYILIDTDSGVFENNEEIDGSTSGNDAAEVDGDMTRITPKVIEKSCWKSIDEVYWQASVLLDGLYAFSDVAGFKELYIDMPDHTATSQRVFYGYIPNQGIVQNPGDNTTRLTAYSHAFNLVNQFIPDEYRDTVEWVPSGASGYVTFSDPSVPITAFLGGSLWNLTTGIKPGNILTITDWGGSAIPVRGFSWGPEVNKWQAIQEMADYCGYIFEVLYDSSQDCAVACFCAVDDIDTYVGTPAAVTFDKDDASKYVLNVSKERRGTEMINRVRVQGRRNKRILNFVDGVTEFTAGHTVLDGTTGAEATIISCTLSSGAWGGTAVGYLIISYDRTADFVDGSTIIDALGAGFGEATMQGNSVIWETYDEYDYYIESAAVTNLEERPRERFFQLEEEYDSTPLIEAKCQAYYDMYALDPTPYNVTFRDRCDLRLWQKVKLTSFTEIPEDWMRIVSIRYTQRSGGAVDVSCTLNNADYVIAQRKMRRSLRNNDVTEIEKIVKAILAKKEVKVAEAVKVQGEGVTVELQDGERIVVGRAPE